MLKLERQKHIQMPGKLKAYKCIRKYKKAEGLRHQLFDLTKKMCLPLNTSSFLLFKVAFLGLYIIKYFFQVHNEPYCLPSNEMGFFSICYIPFHVKWSFTPLQLSYVLINSLAFHTFLNILTSSVFEFYLIG